MSLTNKIKGFDVEAKEPTENGNKKFWNNWEIFYIVLSTESCVGVRHLQVLLITLGAVLLCCMRTSMSIGIVAMTDPAQDHTFDWTHQKQSVILSSFKWGYLVTKLPAGVLAARFGGMSVLTVCVAVNTVATLLLPLGGSYGGWQAVCACRVVQGLAQGLLLPTLHYLLAKWAPEEEKGRLGTIVHASASIGTAVQLMVGGYISYYWGWQAIFYVNGSLGVAWTASYLLLGADSPQTSKMISSEEKLYIQHSLGHVGGHKIVKAPWKAMLTSVPVFALFVANAGYAWSSWTTMTEMPTYINHVFGADIKENGLFSALPYIACSILSFPTGYLSDYILYKKWLPLTTCRKMFNTIGALGAACFLIALSYSPSDITTVVALLTATEAIATTHYCGYNLVHLDMAPNHAGTLMGITGFGSNCLALAAPLVAGFLIQDESLPSEWRKVFFLCAGMFTVSSLFFVLFGTSERQAWNEPTTADAIKPIENNDKQNA